MPGLIQMGNAGRTTAITGINQAAQLEQNRKEEGRIMKQADKAETLNMAGMGAGFGLMAGMGSAAMGAQFGAAAGPIGMLGGAALGYAFGELF